MRNNKAITLIALVITIVVLIILAAVAINLSLGNNGIFNRAKTAKEQYQNAEGFEKEQVGKGSNIIEQHINSGRDTVTISSEEYEQLKNKGKMELLAEQKTKGGFSDFTVKDLKQYSYFVLSIYDGQGIFTSTTFTYDELKNATSSSNNIRIYNSSTTMTRIYYVSDTSVKFCLDSQSGAKLYGVI